MRIWNIVSLVFVTLSNLTLSSQTSAPMNVNNVHATFNSSGDLYSSPPNFTNSIQAPINNPASVFSVGQLWIGGFDQTGQLHVAAQTYRQNGTDFWAGPLDTTTATIAPSVSTQWDRVWEISKSTIDSFLLGLFTQVPVSILDWPANGDAVSGQAQRLAPFADLNFNNVYEPSIGEYPIIRGDKAIYFIYNDHLQNVSHGETAGLPLGVEIHGMAYAFNCPADSALMNTIFLHYNVINRSSNTYSNCYIGNWLDLDLSMNDLVGTDSTSNLCYMYHAGIDAFGINFLNRPMTNSMAYANDFGNLGNPVGGAEYYDYMQSIFTDSSHLTYGGTGYGGTQPVNLCYTGDPMNSTGWNDPGSTSANDRRIIATYGNFVLAPGMSFSFDIALIHARDYSGTVPFQSTQILKSRAQQIQNYYAGDSSLCGGITSVENTLSNQSDIKLFPNPSNGEIALSGNFPEGTQFEVYDMLGQKVFCDELQGGNQSQTLFLNLADGAYIYRVFAVGDTLKSGKLILTR